MCLSRLNVLYLVESLTIGGLQRMTVSLVNGLDRRHYRPAVCCYDDVGELASTLRRDVRVLLLKRRSGIDTGYPFRLARLLKQERIDILHLHNSTALFYGALGGRLGGVPSIYYTEHDGGGYRSHRHRRGVNAILSRLTKVVVAVSRQLKADLVQYGGFESHKIRVIHNGIDGNFRTEAFDRSTARTRLGLGDRQPVLGTVARLDPVKDHRTLLKALEIVIRSFPDSILLIVGDGPERKMIEAEVSKRDLAHYVRLLGKRLDIPELLSSMDLFVSSSLGEGLSMTLIEAMAAGKAILATRVGGTPELIADKVNGLLVPPDNARAFAEAAIELLHDRDRLKRMGEASRRRFRAEFSAEIMVKKYEELYENR